MTSWTIQATVTKLHDGDTLSADLDLGWNIWLRNQRIRFARCNAPEIATPEGKAALAFLQTLVKPGDTLTLVSHGLDKYGRVLGDLTTSAGVDLTDAMINAGHAAPWNGKGAKPVPAA
jgi:micrococcal nuclease